MLEHTRIQWQIHGRKQITFCEMYTRPEQSNRDAAVVTHTARQRFDQNSRKPWRKRVTRKLLCHLCGSAQAIEQRLGKFHCARCWSIQPFDISNVSDPHRT